jgi:hypothetical protein
MGAKKVQIIMANTHRTWRLPGFTPLDLPDRPLGPVLPDPLQSQSPFPLDLPPSRPPAQRAGRGGRWVPGCQRSQCGRRGRRRCPRSRRLLSRWICRRDRRVLSRCIRRRGPFHHHCRAAAAARRAQIDERRKGEIFIEREGAEGPGV